MYPYPREEVGKLAREKRECKIPSFRMPQLIHTYYSGWERESTTDVVFVGEYAGRVVLNSNKQEQK